MNICKTENNIYYLPQLNIVFSPLDIYLKVRCNLNQGTHKIPTTLFNQIETFNKKYSSLINKLRQIEQELFSHSSLGTIPCIKDNLFKTIHIPSENLGFTLARGPFEFKTHKQISNSFISEEVVSRIKRIQNEHNTYLKEKELLLQALHSNGLFATPIVIKSNEVKRKKQNNLILENTATAIFFLIIASIAYAKSLYTQPES